MHFLFLPGSPIVFPDFFFFQLNDVLTAEAYISGFIFFNENPYSKIYVISTELSQEFKNQK